MMDELAQYAATKISQHFGGAEVVRGAPVSFWNYMATVGGYAQCALVFGRVVSVGAKWVTIVTEYGNRTRRRAEDLTYSPDGEEILKKKNI